MERFPKGTTVIHGDARGVDTIAHCIAESLELQIIRFPVTPEMWEVQGKAAGHFRNKRMLDEGGPDLVIAFVPIGIEARGTMNMIAQAEAYGVRVVKIDGHIKSEM